MVCDSLYTADISSPLGWHVLFELLILILYQVLLGIKVILMLKYLIWAEHAETTIQVKPFIG